MTDSRFTGDPARLDRHGSTLRFRGAWTVDAIEAADAELRALAPQPGAVFDLSGVTRMDTAGAWVVHRTELAFARGGGAPKLQGLSPSAEALLAEVRRLDSVPPARTPPPGALTALLERTGRAVVHGVHASEEVLAFYGVVAMTALRVAAQPARLRLTSLVHHMEHAGLDAVPIVSLISFLIGAVLAYQGAQQLQRFGAEVFTINLVAVSVLREVGILLTAIMVAGRSGSAFTAQIGSMKLREEIDAMRTLGLDPIEVLVLPRVLALVLTLPLLGFVAAIMGLAGGGMVCWVALDLSPVQYVVQVHNVVTPITFWVGIIKAPFFAVVIAMIGCFEGLKVEGSAESVGLRTTSSVVLSVFSVIIIDAIFSIVFVRLGI